MGRGPGLRRGACFPLSPHTPGAGNCLFRTESHKWAGSAETPAALGGLTWAPRAQRATSVSTVPTGCGRPVSGKGPPSPEPAPTPACGRRAPWHTYAGGDGGAALLVALGTAVAGDAGHTILAGTLARGLVAGFASGAHRVAIAGCGEHTTEGSEAGGSGSDQSTPSPQGPPHPVAPRTPSQGKSRAGGAKPAHIPEALMPDHLPTWKQGNENQNGPT